MAELKNGSIPRVRVKTGDSRKAIYAKVRQAFTAADLQKYTVVEQGIPMAEIIAEMERIQREVTQRKVTQKTRRKKNKR